MTDAPAVTVWELAAGLHAPGEVRRSLRQTFTGVLDAETLDTMVLLTSEIVTNAIARSRTGAVLTVEVDEAAVIVTVADSRPDAPALTELARVIAEDRNLAWGAHVHRSGKAVWFQVPLGPAGRIDGGGAEAGTVHA
jgi:hypothetical protein